MVANGVRVNGSGSFKELIGEKHVDVYKRVRPLRVELGLPDCKLQTVEKILFNGVRRGDISGASIPDVYYEYVYGRKRDVVEEDRTVIYGKDVEDAVAVERLRRVAVHNIIDTATPLALMAYLCAPKKRSS
jgi:uncharacterized protein YprB with RNaseH-like and TPR domain